jgi:hypothetical protein
MRWFVAFVLLILVGVGASQGPPPGPTENGSRPQQQATEKPNGATTGKDPSPPTPTGSTIGDAYKHGYDAGKKDAQSGPDGWTILADLTPLIVGLFTVGLFTFQVLLMNRLNNLTKQAADAATEGAKAATAGLEASKQLALESKTDTEASLTITRQAANAAEKSAETGERALKLVERPWIGFGVHFDPRNVFLEIKNWGKSVAMMKTCGAKVFIGDVPAPEEVWKILGMRSFGVIMPDQKIDMAVDSPMVRTLKADAKVTLIGSIAYTDIHGTDHMTCDVWFWNGFDFVKGGRDYIDVDKYTSYT